MSEYKTEELEEWTEETCEHCRLLFARQDCASADCSAKKDAIRSRLSELAALKAKTTIEGIGYSEWKEAIAERDALRGEVERLRDKCEECIAVRPERLEQLADEATKWRTRAEKAEASLAAARPLIEAVEKAELMRTLGGTTPGFTARGDKAIISAALAYRAAK